MESHKIKIDQLTLKLEQLSTKYVNFSKEIYSLRKEINTLKTQVDSESSVTFHLQILNLQNQSLKFKLLPHLRKLQRLQIQRWSSIKDYH